MLGDDMFTNSTALKTYECLKNLKNNKTKQDKKQSISNLSSIVFL